MNTFTQSQNSTERYDDGVESDYASMIRMWSAFDRSLNAFKRECGVVAARRKAAAGVSGDRGKRRNS